MTQIRKTETTQTGDTDGGDYSETRTDGTLRQHGDATAWRDMVGDLYGKRLASVIGKVDYDDEENAIKFQSGGDLADSDDRVGSNLQINHEFKIGSGISFKPHIHWFQEIIGGAISHAFVLSMRYRFQRNGYAKNETWTTVALTAGVDDILDFTSEVDGIYNQLSRFPDITVDCNVSDTIQFQIARTDTLGDDMLVYFMDMHGEVDSLGSDGEITKV